MVSGKGTPPTGWPIEQSFNGEVLFLTWQKTRRVAAVATAPSTIAFHFYEVLPLVRSHLLALLLWELGFNVNLGRDKKLKLWQIRCNYVLTFQLIQQRGLINIPSRDG